MSNQSQVRLRVFLLAVCLAPVAVARAATPRVMPLGDSITESTGYRVKLKKKIETAGLQVTWVGGQTDSTGLHHEGHSGYQIQQLYGFSTKWIPAAMPDIILLQIGTNDMWRKREFDAGHLTADQLPAPLLNSLLGKLFDLQPDVAIIVSQIPPMSQYDPQPVPADQKAAVAMAVGAAVRDYVDGIPAVVQAWAKKGKRITTVDMYHALSVTDLVDGVHPNDVGYEKMASTWFPALKSLLMMQPSEVPDAGAASDTAAAGQGGQGGRGGQGGNAGAAGSAGGARGATDEGGSGPDAAGGQGGQGGEGGGDSNADDDAATKKSGCSFGGSSSHVTWLFLLLLAWPLRRRARRG